LISVLVSKKSGASDVATMDLSFADASGAVPSATHLYIAGASAVAGDATLSMAASRSVSVIDGKIDGFVVPEFLSPGLYSAAVSVSGTDGSSAQKSSITIFVALAKPAIGSVSTYPPSIEPGASVLLDLTLAWQAVASPSGALGADPQAANAAAGAVWVRWSKDGVAFAEGLLSSGLDKVVWTAPQAEGAYSVTVEVFPAAPTAETSYAFKSPISEDLKIMVIKPRGESGDDFADPLAFYSMLRLKGSFDDVGTRPRAEQPSAFGSPEIDTYSDGFGYRFGPASGVRIPGLMPPSSAAGATGAFSTLIRLDSTQTDGVLERFNSKDGSYLLVVGLDELRPYAEFQINGAVHRSTASSAIARFPLTLEAVFIPDGNQLDIVWEAEGERISSPSIPLPPAPPEGSAQLGGPESLYGVYDGVGLMVGSASPAFRLASRRAWKDTLVLAEAFEEGAAPAGAIANGEVRYPFGAAELSPASSLSLSPALPFGTAFRVEADISGDWEDCALVFSTAGGDRVFSIGGSGLVSGASGEILGSLAPAQGRLALTLALENGALRIRDLAGGNSVLILSSAKRLVLSVARAPAPERVVDTDGEAKREEPGPARVERILVRTISPLEIGK
jgi:hypothetical protein